MVVPGALDDVGASWMGTGLSLFAAWMAHPDMMTMAMATAVRAAIAATRWMLAARSRACCLAARAVALASSAVSRICQRQSEIVRKRRRNFVVLRRGGVTKSGTSLLKKSVHNLLLLAHKFLAFLQTVRLALDVDYGTMMQNPVQDGGGNSDIGKDLVPLGEGFV